MGGDSGDVDDAFNLYGVDIAAQMGWISLASRAAYSIVIYMKLPELASNNTKSYELMMAVCEINPCKLLMTLQFDGLVKSTRNLTTKKKLLRIKSYSTLKK